jgi:hypothetical protein
MEKRKNKNGPSYSFAKPSFLYGEIELYSNHLPRYKYNFRASSLKSSHIYRDICFIFFIYMYASIKMTRNFKNIIQI